MEDESEEVYAWKICYEYFCVDGYREEIVIHRTAMLALEHGVRSIMLRDKCSISVTKLERLGKVSVLVT